jgi:membrane associated rhomboid family serine protease
MNHSPESASSSLPPSEPLFNVPPVTLLLVLVLSAIQLLRVYGFSPEQDQLWVLRLGFIPLHLREYGLSSIFPWFSTITYSLLHFGWLHFVVNITAILAFGAGVERSFGWKRYVVILGATIIAGALTHFIWFSHDVVILGGISAGVSGLFAIVIGMLQQRNGWRGLIVPSVIWLAINMVIGNMGMPGQDGLSIAWVAHMGGFIAGLAFLPWIMPAYRVFKSQKG